MLVGKGDRQHQSSHLGGLERLASWRQAHDPDMMFMLQQAAYCDSLMETCCMVVAPIALQRLHDPPAVIVAAAKASQQGVAVACPFGEIVHC